MRSMRAMSQSSPLTREDMTHRIGRFYTGQPSWRTRLRNLRRRLGDDRLPPSEEECLIEARKQILARWKAGNELHDPIHALRIVHPLPPVLMAADGKTTLRYVQALKNASTSILNMLLEMTGEAAYRSWDSKEHLVQTMREPRVQLGTHEPVSVAVNAGRLRIHRYMPAESFAPEPYADIRFCVVRDPVDRFVSGLNQFQLMSWRQNLPVPAMTQADIDAWLDRLEAFYAAPKSHWSARKHYVAGAGMQRHLFRQTGFLGGDAGYYTHIFSARQLADVHAFLSDLAGRHLSSFDANSRASRQKLLRAHGLSLERPQLTATQRRRVEALYADDYRVFGRWF